MQLGSLSVSIAIMLATMSYEARAAAVVNEQTISEIVVTSQRREQAKSKHAGNIARLDQSSIQEVQHQHIHELTSKVAGTWIVRGSGQEHQTAIRSPVLTGGGSCGGFLLLEDGIPVRPAGFCNVNQFIEVFSEQAATIEVIRGPGNALFGSNALHGIINVLMPIPGGVSMPHLALEVGSNDFFRLRASLPLRQESNWLISALYADDGGFRDDSGYRQGKIHVSRMSTFLEGDLSLAFTGTYLDQETAGFIYGKDAYKDPALNRTNPNPEAFRDAQSQRLYAIWNRSFSGYSLDIRPFLRHSDMRFMHHGLPGQPVEDNGHTSAGVLSAFNFNTRKTDTTVGVDLDWSDIFLIQTQDMPAKGPPPQSERRPVGKHYDYQVTAVNLAAYIQTQYAIDDKLSLGVGLRVETLRYNYDNRMLTGNTREDGSTCGFGGCLYSRPTDRKDRFTNIAPKLSLTYQINDQSSAYANLTHGFRVPQALELYRLQNGQQVADLDSETIDSFELGARFWRQTWSAEISIYTMKKRDSVFRDALGFNVSGARSRHRGVEGSLNWQLAEKIDFSVNASHARHSYDFNFTPPRGERFVKGNDIDTAPRWLGSAQLRYQSANGFWMGLQWVYLGTYHLEPGNRYSYPGHSLFHIRSGMRISESFDLMLRLNNLMDRQVADRADFAAGTYRYLPGRGRELFIELRYRPTDTS